MAADILPVLISLSNCLASSFTSDFFCFGCLIWRAFASVKRSSNRPCFHKILRRLSVLAIEISFVKRKANSTIEQRKCKGHKKSDPLLTSKMEFNYRIF